MSRKRAKSGREDKTERKNKLEKPPSQPWGTYAEEIVPLLLVGRRPKTDSGWLGSDAGEYCGETGFNTICLGNSGCKSTPIRTIRYYVNTIFKTQRCRTRTRRRARATYTSPLRRCNTASDALTFIGTTEPKKKNRCLHITRVHVSIINGKARTIPEP